MEWLTEAVTNAPLGTMVSWRTPSGPNMGVVIGTEGNILVTVTLLDRSLDSDPSEQVYLDAALTKKLGSVHGLPRVHASIHKVPKSKAFFQHKIKAAGLRPYINMTRALKGKPKAEAVEPSAVVKALQGVFG